MTSLLPPALILLGRRYLPLLLVAVTILFYYVSLIPTVHRWSQWHEGMSHGWMVVAVFIYLVWRSLPWVDRSGPWQWLAYGVLLVSSLCWLALQAVHIVALAELLVLVIMALALACVFGWRSMWRYKSILLLPIFAGSLWGDLNERLVDLSGLAVGGLLGLFSITAHVDGNSIFLPYGHIVIADGCSGLRYLMIALAIGYIQACLHEYPARLFILTLMVAAILGLAANWLRIFVLVLVGYYTQMASDLLRDHELLGWVLFAGLIFGPLYFAPSGPKALPMSNTQPAKVPMRRLLATGFCLLLGPLIYSQLDLMPHPQLLKDVLSPSLQPIPADALPIPLLLTNQGRAEQGLDQVRRVFIQVNQYQRQKEGDKLVPYIGRLFDTEQWLEVHKSAAKKLPHPASLSEYRHKINQRRVVQLQWFILGQSTLGSAAAAKLWQLPAILRSENRFVMVTLQAFCEVDCAGAQEALEQAALDYGPKRQ